VVGVAWYDVEQWGKLKAVAVDPERLEDTYDEWVRMADRAMKDLVTAGLAPQPIHVHVEELVLWCQSQGRPVNGAARAAFALEKLQRGGQQEGQRSNA
jgi:hypothetical protein